jgi:hypothetical protein
MMKRVLLATLIGFLSCAAPAHAQKHAWCKPSGGASIQVKTSTDEILWDYSKSEKDLNKFKIDTINPYGKSVITDVGGLMQGGIMMQEQMRYSTLTRSSVGQICYWYDNVVVTLHIKPTIYIASEFPRGTCKHNAIREHELKHVAVDREIVNKYAALLGSAVQEIVNRKPIYGPYHVAQSKEVEAFLNQQLSVALKRYSQEMDDERKKRQQGIDSLAEYERVNKLCK